MSDWTGYATVAFFVGLAAFIIMKRRREKRNPMNKKQKKILLGTGVAVVLVLVAAAGLTALKIVDTFQMTAIIAAIIAINGIGFVLAMRAK